MTVVLQQHWCFRCGEASDDVTLLHLPLGTSLRLEVSEDLVDVEVVVLPGACQVRGTIYLIHSECKCSFSALLMLTLNSPSVDHFIKCVVTGFCSRQCLETVPEVWFECVLCWAGSCVALQLTASILASLQHSCCAVIIIDHRVACNSNTNTRLLQTLCCTLMICYPWVVLPCHTNAAFILLVDVKCTVHQ